MPRFSVIIPIYNKEKDVETTIKSVLNQTYVDYEVILVDDGSTDNSLNIVNTIEDDRIQIFTKQNEGVSKTRNYGIKKAKAEHIAFLDADDYWYPNHLENLNFLITTYPNHNWFASAYEKKRTEKLTVKMDSPILKNGDEWYGEVEDFFKYCYKDCLVWTSTVCFKKEFFNNLNGFSKSYTHGEDTDLWIRAALQSSLIFSNKITATHNLISNNRSTDIPVLKRNIIDINSFIDKEKNNPSLKKYLDLNRFSLIIKNKLSGVEKVKTNEYLKEIDITNLNGNQQFLIKQPKFILKFLFSIQKIFEKLGIRLSSF